MPPEDTKNLYLMLGEIRGDLKHLIVMMNRLHVSNKSLSARITKLEEFRWTLVGLACTIPAVLTVAGWYVSSKL